jgi:hypothetical protein
MFSKKTVTPTPSPDPVAAPAAAAPAPPPVMRHRPTTLSSTFEELMQNSGSK